MNLDARTEGLPPPLTVPLHPPPSSADDQISSLTNPIATPSCCSSRSPSSAGSSNFPLHSRRSTQTLALTLTTGSLSHRSSSSGIRTPRSGSRPTNPTPRDASGRRRSDLVNAPNRRPIHRRSSREPRNDSSSGTESLSAAVSQLLQKSNTQDCCDFCSNNLGRNSRPPVCPSSKDLRLTTYNPNPHHHQIEPYAKSRKTDPEGYLFTCYLDYNRYIKPSPTICSDFAVRPESLQYSTPCTSACETPRSSASSSSYLSIPGRRLYSRPPTPVPLTRAKEVHRIVMAGVPVDVKELTSCYLFVAEIPGLKNTDVKVQVENDSILKISGERRREECEECEVKYIRVERQAGKFTRKFNLPANADLEHITAACQDGLLSVVVPKSPPIEQRRPKNFDVKIIT